jgi:flagellar export protein FliJ
MKSRDSLARLRRFQVDETRRRLAQIETMIAEFSKMGRELDREIALEEQRSGITDISHFAYPTYASAARTRRDNLQRSAEELTGQLDEARQFLEETLTDPSNARMLEGGGTRAGPAGGKEAGPDATRGIRSRRIFQV